MPPRKNYSDARKRVSLRKCIHCLKMFIVKKVISSNFFDIFGNYWKISKKCVPYIKLILEDIVYGGSIKA